ncbi:MAG: hypothetical protein FJ149_00845 [Euryarchaeota archaeon]|nr:hypothetical protein [Euryarchaeota archaeon]
MPECPVCGSPLAGVACPQCSASARIQETLLEVGRVQARGINVNGAVVMVRRARELLEERDHEGVEDFLSGALDQAREAERLQGPIRKILDRAAEAKRRLERSGRDTHRLQQALGRAERFLQAGDLEGARLLAKRIPAFLRELQGPAAVPGGSMPRYLSSCPRCSKLVMKAWNTCPHCLVPLPPIAPIS